MDISCINAINSVARVFSNSTIFMTIDRLTRPVVPRESRSLRIAVAVGFVKCRSLIRLSNDSESRMADFSLSMSAFSPPKAALSSPMTVCSARSVVSNFPVRLTIAFSQLASRSDSNWMSGMTSASISRPETTCSRCCRRPRRRRSRRRGPSPDAMAGSRGSAAPARGSPHPAPSAPRLGGASPPRR